MLYAPKKEDVCENIERGNREYRIKKYPEEEKSNQRMGG
jgi:hypothetical protein